MDDRELLWNDFKLNAELHRSYLELSIKLNMFYYAFTGAILSFYFSHLGDETIALSLLVPLVMSIGLAIFFFWASRAANVMHLHIKKTGEALGLNAFPDGRVLKFVCILFGSVMSVITLALIYHLACV